MGELHNTYIDSACNYIVHALNTPGELMNGRHTTLNRMLITMVSIFALVALMGAASATDYYLATWGDNSSAGTSLDTAWKDPSYAVAQIGAGDTLWVVNGTYMESKTVEIEAEQFGSEGNWVRIKAYNGTPIWDGNGTGAIGFLCGESDDIEYTPAYVELDGIHIKQFYYSEAEIKNVTNMVLKNCTFANTSMFLPKWRSIMHIGGGICNITIDNCSFIDTGDFCISMYGARYGGTNASPYNVSVTNCYFAHTINHGGMQISGYVYDITVEGCTFVDCYYGLNTYFHNIDEQPNRQHNIIFRNNTFTDMEYSAIGAIGTVDSLFINNTINGCEDRSAFDINFFCNNITIEDNIVSNAPHLYNNGLGYNANGVIIFKNNVYSNISTSQTYRADAGGTLVIKDDAHQPHFQVMMLNEETSGNATIEYSDGRVFDYAIDGGSNYSITYPMWYPNKSNFTFGSNKSEGLAIDITPYNITLRPTYGHLYDVTVDTWDEDSDTYRITASSTQRDNPTWVNLTTKSASATYNITRDGEPYTKATTGADGVLRYRYTGTWDGPQTFEFSYASDGADIPPTARAGSDQTVNVNSSVTLDGSASTGDGITSYAWDFDSRNGIQQDATDAIVTHIYTGPGTYIATLTVTDTSGQTDSDTVLITVIEGTTQTTDVSRITNPIVPDGSLSEWAGADTVTFAGSDNTATVSLTWDTNNLYFGFDVTDTNLQASGTDEADPLHLDDSIEIYLDTNHNGGATMQVDDYHFIINLNGALVDDQGTGSGKNYSWTSHINYAIDLDGTLNDDSDADNGYVVEVAIPWSDIGGVPVAGDIMGLDLAVNDNDGTAVRYFDWCNLSSWAVPDGWGNMTFVESFDNNTLHIADEVTASHGHSATVPIMIYNATGVACAGVKLTYDVSVVAVTGATQGDFTAYFGFDDEHAANGWVTINTYITETQLTGDLIVANVTLEATGSGGDTSPLNLEVISMTDKYGNKMPGTTHNGTFTIRSQPPVLDPVGDKSVDEGQTLSFTISATDPDGDSLTYSAGNLPAGAVFDTAARTFSWTPGYDRSGTYPDVHFEVSDGELADRENIAITVNNVNRAPAISGLVNQSGTAGVAWTYDISSCISDPDGDSLTVAVNDDNVSVIGFALTFNYSVVVEDKPVIITVTDSSLSDSQTIFVTVVENTPPTLTDPSASQPIPDDTDGVPLWGERSTLNITITDDSGIASVTIDLSPIGGSSAQPMNNIGGNIWSVTTNASAGIPPQTYHLQVTATNIYGKSNTSVIPLTVVRNGDTTGDGVANIADAMLLANHASHPDQYTISSEFVADVNGDGDINIVDAMLLANYISYPGRYILR